MLLSIDESEIIAPVVNVCLNVLYVQDAVLTPDVKTDVAATTFLAPEDISANTVALDIVATVDIVPVLNVALPAS